MVPRCAWHPQKVRAMPTCTTRRGGVIGPHAHGSVARQVVDDQDNTWRGWSIGPHARGNVSETCGGRPERGGEWAAKTANRPLQQRAQPPVRQLLGPANDTTRNTGRSGRQNAVTRHRTRREERMTVQGPVKKPQPGGMSQRGRPPPTEQQKPESTWARRRAGGGHRGCSSCCRKVNEATVVGQSKTTEIGPYFAVYHCFTRQCGEQELHGNALRRSLHHPQGAGEGLFWFLRQHRLCPTSVGSLHRRILGFALLHCDMRLAH